MHILFGHKWEKKNSRIGLELNYAKNLDLTQKYNFLVYSLCVEIVRLGHKTCNVPQDSHPCLLWVTVTSRSGTCAKFNLVSGHSIMIKVAHVNKLYRCQWIRSRKLVRKYLTVSFTQIRGANPRLLGSIHICDLLGVNNCLNYLLNNGLYST